MNPNATGQGGARASDSGSPRFLNTGRGDVSVAVTLEKPYKACAADAVNYRPGTPSARRFLGQFVTLL
jgi:hypothetical protein